jgi:hypothetical protein
MNQLTERNRKKNNDNWLEEIDKYLIINLDAYPDLHLTHFGEERTGFYDIITCID